MVRFWYSCYNLAIESARQILEVLVPRATHTLASSVVTIQLEPDALAGRTSLVSAHRIWIFWIYVKLTLHLRDFLRDAMGKKNITDDMKRAILELQKEGKSYAEIAARLGVGKATVHLWVTRAKGMPHGVVPPTPKPKGRPRLTSPQTDRLLRRRVLESPSISARELRAENPAGLKDVALRTIQHRLQKHLKLPTRRPAAKPLLTAPMKAKRLAFAKKYVKWTTSQWENVMFSDESRFLTFTNRRRSVRRPLGSNRFDPRFTTKTVKHPPGRRSPFVCLLTQFICFFWYIYLF